LYRVTKGSPTSQFGANTRKSGGGLAGRSAALQVADVKRTTRRKITVETERLLVISSHREAAAWCEQCGARAKMVDPQEAAAIAGLSARTIFRQVESGQLHFTETAAGALLICLKSLMNQT
jgi:hypothetical protein